MRQILAVGVALCVGLGAMAQEAPPDTIELLPLAPEEFEDETVKRAVVEPVTAAYPPGTELFVSASSLALRKSAAKDAPLILYLPKDAWVMTLRDSGAPVPLEVAGIPGYWLRVEYRGHRGYVFDGYLAPAPTPLEDRLNWDCVPGERAGPITRTTSYEELVATFGLENLEVATVQRDADQTEPGTAIFPGGERLAVVQWEKFHRVPEVVIVLGTGWKTLEGVGVGTSLAELVTMNGRALTFRGFGGGSPGLIRGWGGGTFDLGEGFEGDIEFYLQPRRIDLTGQIKELQADRIFSSEHASVEELDLYVSMIRVRLRDKAADESKEEVDDEFSF